MDTPNLLIPTLLAIIMSISIHEFMHAYLADKLGDNTPAYQGRLTLNPIAHFDPLGALLILFTLFAGFGIGWGKPVQFNPWNLKNPVRDAALISLAGPASNFVQAIIFAIIWRLTPPPINDFFFIFVAVNVSLGLFNLLPIAPLDGFKVVAGLLPKSLAFQWQQLERYGLILLIFLIFPFGGQPLLFAIINPIRIFIITSILQAVSIF